MSMTLQRLGYASAILFALIAVDVFAVDTLTPEQFERVWTLNSQRNIHKRFSHYSALAKDAEESIYRLGLDAISDKNIRTSAGDQRALVSRMSIYYQDADYLGFAEWLSATPQPQTTEGFAFGDSVLGKKWKSAQRETELTLGVRWQMTPQTTTVGSEEVFNAVNNASADDFSLFFHIDYKGYALGTYSSIDRNFGTTAMSFPILKTDRKQLSSTVAYHASVPDAQLNSRYEVSLDYLKNGREDSLEGSIIMTHVPDLSETTFSNAYVSYTMDVTSDIDITGGLSYYLDIERDEERTGASLSISYRIDEPQKAQIGISLQRNSFGDINSLIIYDEPVFSFFISYPTAH